MRPYELFIVVIYAGALVLQAAANAASNSVGPAGCGTWVEGTDFYRFDLINVKTASKEDCRSFCQSHAGCNAVTLAQSDNTCYLKQIPVGYEPRAGNLDAVVSVQLCSNETTRGPQINDENAPPPGPAPPDDTCGEWHWHFSIQGVEVPFDGSPELDDRQWCLNRCVETAPCNTALYDYRKRSCILREADAAAAPQRRADYEAIRLCDLPAPIECGEWQNEFDIPAYDIQTEKELFEGNGTACMQRCQTIPGCNAVAYRKFTKHCWPKKVPAAGLRSEPIAEPSADSMILCPDQILAEGSAAMSAKPSRSSPISATGVAVRAPGANTADPEVSEAENNAAGSRNLTKGAVVGIAIAAAVVASAGLAALMMWMSARSRRTTSGKHGAQQGGKHVMQSSFLGSTALTNILGSTTVTGSGLYPQESMATSSKQESSTVGHGDISHALVQMRNVVDSSTTEVTSATAELHARPPYGESPRFIPECMHPHIYQNQTSRFMTSQVPATTWEMSVLPVPEDSATRDQLMNFVHNQLDRIEASASKGQKAELMDGLHMTGSGPHDRLEGGQAIVQMVYSSKSRLEYAVKFFVSRSAFEQEKSLYSRHNPLNKFLPQVLSIIHNDDRQLVDPAGHALPPYIVMERGESLDLWSQRNAPDRAQAFTVIYHIAQRMMEFHAAGYVHRDLKPGNVMWLPRTNRWTVIDFGCAARHREVSSIGYTLRYAAPEVIKAKQSGEREMVVKEALDAWSLGVMAFEMCTGTPPFPRGMDAELIMDQIGGVKGEMLPWEGERLTPQIKAKLQLFQDALLQLLHRDPQQRPSMRQFCRTCAKVLGEHSVVDGEL